MTHARVVSRVCSCTTLLITLLVHATCLSADAPAPPHAEPQAVADPGVAYEARGVEGDLVVHERFRSRSLGDRRVFVFLPDDYATSGEQTYPVLYLLDGQNFFDPEIAAGGEEWAVDELLTRQPQGVPKLLLVAVPAGSHAVREFSPPGSVADALGDEYLSFIVGELKPYIDLQYRTRPDPESTLIVGQASSAVLALYAAWTRGDTFAGAIALDFPDVDLHTMQWARAAPNTGRPWIWLEQSWSDSARPSTTEIVAILQRHAETRVAVTSQEMHRAARILAAMRAMPVR